MTKKKKGRGPSLLFERQDAVVIVSINDPPWNPMSLAFMDALEDLVPKIAEDRAIRAVVLEGAGEEHFSVGMNLKELAGAARSQRELEAVLDQRLRVLSAIENMEKPWIAVLYGYCLGGGLELPLACHFRLAAQEGAKIGLPELDIGTVPAWGGTARLTRCVGRMHALDMILRAKKISGPEAHRIGLVNEVWPNTELKARARELARELAEAPPCSDRPRARTASKGSQPSWRNESLASTWNDETPAPGSGLERDGRLNRIGS